jgi:hypothetical protein
LQSLLVSAAAAASVIHFFPSHSLTLIFFKLNIKKNDISYLNFWHNYWFLVVVVVEVERIVVFLVVIDDDDVDANAALLRC